MINASSNKQIRSQYVDVTDIASTTYDILGITPPRVVEGVEQMPLHGVSFAQTFNDGNKASAHTTQYKEMEGTRSMYKDGWFLSFVHKKGQDFSKDTYKLYDTTKDFSMQKDVATENPDKVKELSQLWNTEAKKYDVLPLDDRKSAELVAMQAAKNIAKFNSITLYPGISPIDVNSVFYYTALNRSYDITAEVNRKSTSDEGVLLAIGGNEGGMSFYIKDNKLVYDYNFDGKETKVTSNIDVPTGNSNLKLQYVKDPLKDGKETYSGTATLFINNQNVGSVHIDQVYPMLFDSSDGLSVGRDAHSLVSSDYRDKGDFAFSGTFNKVVIDSKKDYVLPHKK